MKQCSIETPIGMIYALADGKALHYLGFKKQNAPIGHTKPLEQIRTELESYFLGKLSQFQTPIYLDGSSFQNKVWEALQKIPFGQTKSYKDVAALVDNPKGSRAVGNANGANPFIIIVPCHRVIQADGTMGGYSAGLEKKVWLLNHEKRMKLSIPNRE